MEKWERLLSKLLFPSVPVAVVLIPISAGMLIYCLIGSDVPAAVRYVSYTVSTYALAVLCTCMMRICGAVKRRCKAHPIWVRCQTDMRLRIKISLYASVCINGVCALMHLISGLDGRSVWFCALAGYYSMLAIIRGLLLWGVRGDSPVDIFVQWKKYRLCGILLAVMTLLLSFIVLHIVWQRKGFQYHDIHTIAMAAYTFTVTIMAVVNLVRYRKYCQPLLSAEKAVSVAAALVSMLSLETAMLNAFGSEAEEHFRRTMTFFTGIGVCTFIFGLGIYMIVRSSNVLHGLDGSDG